MEEAENQNREEANQMSLNEKMNLWHRNEESDNLDIKNPGEDEENADDSDYEADKESEANEDEIKEYVGYEADETELPELAAYRSFIRGAPAYDWFLNNIRRECTLAPPEPNLNGRNSKRNP